MELGTRHYVGILWTLGVERETNLEVVSSRFVSWIVEESLGDIPSPRTAETQKDGNRSLGPKPGMRAREN
jgi:hypothetical protein